MAFGQSGFSFDLEFIRRQIEAQARQCRTVPRLYRCTWLACAICLFALLSSLVFSTQLYWISLWYLPSSLRTFCKTPWAGIPRHWYVFPLFCFLKYRALANMDIALTDDIESVTNGSTLRGINVFITVRSEGEQHEHWNGQETVQVFCVSHGCAQPVGSLLSSFLSLVSCTFLQIWFSFLTSKTPES